ncbi:MAG: glucose 1-dehydrogenase [Peptococcia bacterium]
MRLKDKVCIITGGGKGIGEATSYKFAAEGAKVVIADIDQAAADKAVENIKAKGGEAIAIKVDVTNKDSVAQMVKATTDNYGRIDVLVNNAGIIMDATLAKMTDEQFDRVISINLRGVYNCAKGVVDVMTAQGSGVIINASSIVGLYGNYGQTNYAATKWAAIGMVKTWAKELGRKGIRAVAVCPGFIDTPILAPMPQKVIDGMVAKVPLGRLGKPEEIASTYAFLASDEASYITGVAIEVGGGVTL